MKNMPYALKQKIRQYDNAVKKVSSLYEELLSEFENSGVPYENLTGLSNPYDSEPCTEGLAYINNNEGDIEENIDEIEHVFLHFVNKE